MASGEEQLRERIGSLYGAINSFDGRPTASQLDEVELVTDELAKKRAAFDALSSELEAANRTLGSRNLEPIRLMSREQWEKQDSGTTAGASKGHLRSMMLQLLSW